MLDLTPFVRESAALGAALHAVEVTVAGDPVVVGASPFTGPDVPQRQYSVSKTVTGIAVGLLAAEGGLRLEDGVSTYFPEQGECHPWVARTTVRDLLTMRGPHASTTYKLSEGSWLSSWFTVPPTHPPGSLFTYDTSGSYVLAALVERLAGTTLAEYLRPRLLDPLGVSPDLRFLTGPDDVSHGGSGLVCRPHDLTLLARLLLDDGVHDGASLLPREFVREATTAHADTSAVTWGAPFRGGYGYQLWVPERGGFLAFGLGGQIVHGLPERDLTVVVTADAQACQSGDQRLLDLVLRHLVDPFLEPPADIAPHLPGAPPHSPTPDALAWPMPRHDDAHAVPARGRHVAVAPGTWPHDLELDLGARAGVVASRTGGWRLEYDVDAPRRQVLGSAGRSVVTAGWSAPRALDVECRVLDDELAVVRLRLVVDVDGTVAVRGQGFGETLDPRWSSVGAFSPSRSR
ncbi:serine hydrolase domain-containing protein [Cellulosimicrobium sp. Marseille-Q4280]|uniref:serine hydrolase domain-containing protein n=1 Tax=Cellulosimicrobium sp. Marseille-Q4280 TaxID=2937992 RepID=UPI00203E2B37|nr:serine hydrolase domain-containing protein [Cellulosimicrobium sp. Marseille-Q4280]